MERVLKELQPASVFSYFEDLTRIPHGSYNCKAVSDYVVAFAKKHNLSVVQDEFYNVVITKEKSEGYPSDETVMLQGHLDMVCEKNSDNPIDMTKDPLNIGIDGDWIHANGTTLGGDDGIAVAYCMAILADDTIVHPRLEVVLTTEEETGMEGATGLNTDNLKARYMINVDSEDEGFILTSCAGGNKSTVHLPIVRKIRKGIVAELLVDGCFGGHSGAEINKGRANANIVLGRVLHELVKLGLHIITMDGGQKDNAIPREARAVLLFDKADAEEATKLVASIEKDIRNEYKSSDSGIKVTLTIGDTEEREVLTRASSDNAIGFLFHSMNGIQTMSFEIDNLVESSLNLGIMETRNDEIIYSYAIRSSKASLKEVITEKMRSMAAIFDGTMTVVGSYPAWEYRADSRLQELAKDKYKELTGKSPEIYAIHAGVECGLFAEKMGQMDMISIGPDMKDIHTPKEKLSISSTQRTWEYLLLILKDFGAYCK